MIDLRKFEEEPQKTVDLLATRNVNPDSLKEVASIIEERKRKITEVEQLKAERNSVTKDIATLKAKSKSDPDAASDADKKIKAMKELGEKIKTLDQAVTEVSEKLDGIAMTIPNLPHESVPVGKDDDQNEHVMKWGTESKHNFKAKDHVDLGESLGILDFKRASKIGGARFSIYQGAGASLQRALVQFMLDTHASKNGYYETVPPYLVNRATLLGVGQLPKFEEDLFKTGVENRELYLIPTAEVPLTYYYGDEILDAKDLPKYFTAYTPCFRSEAGSYGKDTRGIIRMHQFHKVELVKFVKPEDSFNELEKMTEDAEGILKALELPYQKVILSTGSMGFNATKTYDLEVWLPSQQVYREISSCSNCGDFQARRSKIRFRREPKSKPEYVHTLNGSGLAVDRTVVAILDNFQDADGTVKIPKVLHKYLEGRAGFENRGSDLILVPINRFSS